MRTVESYRELLELPTEAIYRHVLKTLVADLNAERGCLWLEAENRFIYEGDEDLRKKFPFSRQAFDAVLDQGRTFCCFDSSEDPRVDPEASIRANNIRSCLCAAARDAQGEILAICYVDSSTGRERFTEEDLEFFNSVLAEFSQRVNS